ncbi:nucleoside hydrolase-like [Planococcus citri]|uniref:nucleoside hydrolase-like n=1 Tax=Planococcus citri TaxID=170843 RepID=UPI0031F88858
MFKKSKFTYQAFILVICEILIVANGAPSSADKPKCKEKLIIDTDAGSDDAVAILLFLEEQKQLNQCSFEILAITCSYGNIDVKQVETNVRKTLTIANRPDIPIYAGASRSILRKKGVLSSFGFGEDGFGDYKFEDKILGEVDRSNPASLALIELSKTHAGEINILIVGPMTNVALAASADEGFMDRIKHVYVMGSSIAGVGNIAPGIEFNFEADPEASYILLNSTTSSKLTLFPWETGVNSGFTIEWRKDAFKGHDSKVIQFLDGIESVALNLPRYTPVDAFIAAVMLKGDKLVKTSLETHVEVVTDGAARGAVLVDYNQQLKSEIKNAKIIMSIDIEEYKKLFLCIFAGVCDGLK